MTFPVQLKYGAQPVLFEFAEKPEVLTTREPRRKVTEELFAARLGEVVGQGGLDLSRPAVVVADKTRLCEYARYLPVLLRVLTESGAEPSGITVHIAYGTHPRQSDPECSAIYGSAYGAYRFVHHDCTPEERFVKLGRTSRGTPVMLEREVVEASCLITFGAISHHYFAGYGGGRKLVFPGLGFRNAIYHNHGLFLDAKRRTLAAGCRPGVLDGNPLAEDLAEVEAFRPVDLAVHGILDSGGNVCDLLAGSGPDHFRAACAAHGSNCETAHAPLYDVVVASCGGHPKDINFIQSHKAIHNAARFVRDGGTLVVLAQSPEGVGSRTFLRWFEMGGFHAAFDKLSERYEGNGGTALAMMSKTRRIRILVATELDQAVGRLIGFEKISVEDARRMARAMEGSLAVIPNASLLVKV
jgi:nickel-dependent lactate racemase